MSMLRVSFWRRCKASTAALGDCMAPATASTISCARPASRVEPQTSTAAWGSIASTPRITLAQRCAAAAKEIKGLISDSVEKVESGSKLVGEAGSTMDEIVDSVKRVTDVMAEIMAASQEQSAGIEQVNQAIGQMDQVTQQNAALVEESTASSNDLAAKANMLFELLSAFRMDRTAPIAAATRSAPAARVIAFDERRSAAFG